MLLYSVINSLYSVLMSLYSVLIPLYSVLIPLYSVLIPLSSVLFFCGRRSGLMVSALDLGASGLGSSPRRGHCVVFLGKTLYSHGASLHPGV